jgi:predicted RNase H-related nuclease YkuK (DUF458 family)
MNNTWLSASGSPISDNDMFSEIHGYIVDGGRVFIGTDSQIDTNSYVFVTAICLHKRTGLKYATYFYNKSKVKEKDCKVLRVRIMKEVQRSIDIGLDLLSRYPDADVEIHVDIGKTNRSYTRVLVDPVRGWLSGIGFGCKIKPNSWASSAVADHHTK